jgi:hypothetical protein
MDGSYHLQTSLSRPSSLAEPIGGTAAPESPPAIFLHTAWRSGGTWIWSRCRQSARVRAFYEPLHEHLSTIRRREIAQLRPGSWQSNHSDTDPYFQEYRGLIRPTGRGVAGHERRFAFDRFFLAPDEADAPLAGYIASLVAEAGAAGCIAVLKFCRSQGRVAWFEQQFPDALHAVVVRDPLAQWQSTQRLLHEQRNRYFTVAPILVLARNARHPLVRDAVACLDVRLPDLHSDDLAYGVERCWRHLRRQSDAERYRGFLAFWAATSLAALSSRAMVIDATAMATNPMHRGTVEGALGDAIGDAVTLAPRSGAGPPCGAACAEAHRAAAAMIWARRISLEPGRLDILLGKLLADGDKPAPRPGRQVPSCAEKPRPAPPRAVTAGLIVAANLLQQLRHLHGALVSRLRQLRGG